MSEEDGVRCEGCARAVPSANQALHSLRCPGILEVGAAVWYLDQRSGEHLRAIVRAVDRSIKPEGYTVKLGDSERETERTRLVVNLPAEAAAAP